MIPVVQITLSQCNIIELFSQNKPVELRVDATDQQNDVKLFLYNLARKYADRHFQWNDLEQSLETEFNLEKNSLDGKLKELQGPLMHRFRSHLEARRRGSKASW
mmetsp:Transcript_50822/g.61166  ORF Transcript_50822/g.61166 Transcript_50822/m.61166 type:complete len:104 (-) Transcript_50822:1199-1510(-)